MNLNIFFGSAFIVLAILLFFILCCIYKHRDGEANIFFDIFLPTIASGVIAGLFVFGMLILIE